MLHCFDSELDSILLRCLVSNRFNDVELAAFVEIALGNPAEGDFTGPDCLTDFLADGFPVGTLQTIDLESTQQRQVLPDVIDLFHDVVGKDLRASMLR